MTEWDWGWTLGWLFVLFGTLPVLAIVATDGRAAEDFFVWWRSLFARGTAR